MEARAGGAVLGRQAVQILLLRMRIRRLPAAMPCVIPEVVQLHELSMIVGERHVDHTGKHLAAGIRKSSRRRGRGTVVVPVDQTEAHAMYARCAPGSMAVVAVGKVCRIQGGICFQREHVVPD